jgi:predicted membrane channel-forming protein YqfA (hemolysin III family)
MFDLINGLIQVVASGFILLSVVKVFKEKKVAGVSIVHVGFFVMWGLFTVAFFTHLGQPFSAAGAMFVAAANVAWFLGLITYRR